MSNTNEIPVGAVLSDEDIKAEMQRAKEAKKAPLVADENGEPLDFDGKDAELLQPSCVDMRVRRIYVPGKGKRIIQEENEKWALPPGAIVHIESRERINTPPNIMGFLIPKNRKSEEGLLMLNAGHVDPNWEKGFLTAEVMNVTTEDHKLKIGDPIFSVVFVYTHTRANKKAHPQIDKDRMERAVYMAATRPISLHQYYADEVLHERFALKSDIWRTRTIILTAFGAFIGAVAALAAGVYLGIWLWQNANWIFGG
jgi:deoxycytidine triphosphate deaminase